MTTKNKRVSVRAWAVVGSRGRFIVALNNRLSAWRSQAPGEHVLPITVTYQRPVGKRKNTK